MGYQDYGIICDNTRVRKHLASLGGGRVGGEGGEGVGGEEGGEGGGEHGCGPPPPPAPTHKSRTGGLVWNTGEGRVSHGTRRHFLFTWLFLRIPLSGRPRESLQTGGRRDAPLPLLGG